MNETLYSVQTVALMADQYFKHYLLCALVDAGALTKEAAHDVAAETEKFCREVETSGAGITETYVMIAKAFR